MPPETVTPAPTPTPTPTPAPATAPPPAVAPIPPGKVRAELHSHTQYSPDSDLALADLVAALQRAQVNVVAVTDHNTIEGALQLQQTKPAWLSVIVGEEISTAEGDLIGLFLTSPIEPGLPLLDTIMQIKAQGGIVIVPHAFDHLRHGAMGGAVLQTIVDKVDFMEVFNARCVLPSDNTTAKAFASENNIYPSVASDAHFAAEHGNATCLMNQFTDAASFRSSLQQATFETKLAGPLVHLRRAWVKLRKKPGPAKP
jgi:predicted metal-dependent phosphoesterase TrpH